MSGHKDPEMWASSVFGWYTTTGAGWLTYSSTSAVQACCDSPSLSSAELHGALPTTVCQSPKFLATSICICICHQLSVARVRVHCSTFGTGAMQQCTHYLLPGPTAWNSLPDHVWDAAVDSKQFRWDLKTYLFTEVAKHLKRNFKKNKSR